MSFRPKFQGLSRRPGRGRPSVRTSTMLGRTEFICERCPVKVSWDYTLALPQTIDEACPEFSQCHTTPGKQTVIHDKLLWLHPRTDAWMVHSKGINLRGLTPACCSVRNSAQLSVTSVRREAQMNHPRSACSTHLPSPPRGTENRPRRWRGCHGWARQSPWVHPSALGYETRTSVFWPCRWAGPQNPEKGKSKTNERLTVQQSTPGDGDDTDSSIYLKYPIPFIPIWTYCLELNYHRSKKKTKKTQSLCWVRKGRAYNHILKVSIVFSST